MVLAHPLGLRFRLGPDQAAKGEPSALYSPAFLSTGECGVNGSPGQGPGPLPPWTLKPVCSQERSAPPIRDSTAPGRRGAGGPRERRGPAGEHDQPLLPQSGQRIRATLRLSYMSLANQDEPATRVAAIKIPLDHFLDDRPEIPALIRFAPEDCKALTPARNGSHTWSGTCQNDGTAPGRERSAPDAEGDRLPPWREKGLKNRAKVMDRAACL